MKVVVPPHQSGDAGGFMRVLGERRHEGQIDVDMRVDKAGKDGFSFGVDDLCVGRSV